VVPWVPVIPVEVVPSEAGGDIPAQWIRSDRRVCMRNGRQ
jgi:hypothetical protein